MLPTGTVTFLFTDIQGSTSLWERKPEKMVEALHTHNATLRQAIEANGGVIFKTVGDEFQAAFPTALQAVRAAIEGQRALGTAPWNELGELKVRMGLHTGEAALDPGGDEYAVSHTKNRAARIMSAAHGGQILLSKETANLILRGLPEEVSLKNMGEHRFKGLALPEHLHQVCAPGLIQDFPPNPTALAHPHNLPLQLTSFVGRGREAGDVSELLAENRLVTLTGSGGIGKTRLSLRVAEEVLERYSNGVWFVELAELANPELVPRTIAAALGLQESSNRSPPDQLLDTLREKELLIVLDNCEHVITECAKISEALLRDCLNLKILASSREALRVSGEIIYQVSPLSVPGPKDSIPLEALSDYCALQLFSERAAAVDPNFQVTADNAQMVAQICRRLDGIPLAIELAAARVGAFSVEQIAARLDNRFRLLTGGSRTAAARQQTLRASIDWSYSLLEEAERLLLMRLSVFQGGWTLALASEVCGFDSLDEFDVLDGLSQLVNKSLVRSVRGVDGSRSYRQLETIRTYAREKLLESGFSEIVRNRHLEVFTHLVETAEPNLRGQNQVEWMDRLEAALDNLRAALEWALEVDPLKGLRLATAMFWFWNNRGPRVEAESWLRLLQERLGDQADVDLALLANARARQAHLQMSIGRLGKEITKTAKEALKLAESLGEDGQPVQAIALWVMAMSVRHVGLYTKSHHLGRQCLEIAIALGDRFMIAESYEVLIDVEPDPVSVRHFAEKHLALRRELGDLDGQIIAHFYMAVNEFWSGDLVKARQLCETGMEIARKVKNHWGGMEGHSILGYFYRTIGEMDRAVDHFQQALAVVQDTGEQGRVVRQLNFLGYAYGTQRDWPEAKRCLQQAIHISRSSHFALWEIISCINLGEVAGTFGETAVAERYYQAAVKVDRSVEHLFLGDLVAYGAGKAALLRGELVSANNSFLEALKAAAETGNRRLMKYSFKMLAVCALRSGHIERAIRLYGMIASRDWLLWPTSIPWLVPYDLDELITKARGTLEEAEFARIYAEGQALTLEKAVPYALDEFRSLGITNGFEFI